MELWVRSQNKGALIKVEMLGNTDGIIHSYSGVNKTILGKYKSDERAIEVLDEIQNILNPIVSIKQPKINADDLIHSMSEYVTIQTTQQVEYDLKQAGQFVYEMPKE